MRSEVIYGACGALFLISSAWAQDAPYDSRSDRAVTGTPGAFSNLSPGEQSIARALAASEVRRDGRVPLSLNQIATLKQSGMGFGQVLHQMRADGDTNANNLGSVVSGSRHDLNADRHDGLPRADHDGARMSDRDDGRDFDHDGPRRFDRDNDRHGDRDWRVAPIVTIFGVPTTTECDSAIAIATATPIVTTSAFATMMERDGPIRTTRVARNGILPADQIRTRHRSVLVARRQPRLRAPELRARLQCPPRHRRRPPPRLAAPQWDRAARSPA